LDVSVGERRDFLAMWTDVRQLVEARNFDELVRRYGADFVANLHIAELPKTIALLETQIAQGGT
jgi:hypothetical protein